MKVNLTTKLAIKAAIAAGKEILKIYESGDFEVQLKGDDSPLTKADLASHHKIISFLEPTGIPVLSEEGKAIPYQERKNWKQLWIVDPIDGTKEFIKRNGEFTVNIALIENQIPVMGVIFAPALGDLYFSEQSLGAFKIAVNLGTFNLDKDLEKARKLPLDRKDKTFTIVASRSHMSPETEEYVQDMKEKHGDINLISRGSSLKLCMVAEGQADCYPRFAPTMEWDTAAPQAVVEAAGGRVLVLEGRAPLRYAKPGFENPGFVCEGLPG